eukprot:XP_014780828.1 PREDICTED: uncharacterized protein LOC106876693 isoform X2 [Octopus bimaculoides]
MLELLTWMDIIRFGIPLVKFSRTTKFVKNDRYHWDTSDWAAPHTTLPNISEVPVKEILDSPSSTPQSNDSNTHVDDVNDADMDDMDNDSEYCGDCECGENDDDNNAADFHPAANFHHFLELAPYADEVNEGPQRFHPNFMPDFDQPPGGAALDNWPAPPGAENGNQPPHSDEEENSERCRLRRHLRRGAALARYPPLDASDYEHSTAAMADDMSVSVGGCTSTNVSCSDISGLCDIDDSDMNITDESDNDIHPVKFNSAHLHTQV